MILTLSARNDFNFRAWTTNQRRAEILLSAYIYHQQTLRHRVLAKESGL